MATSGEAYIREQGDYQPTSTRLAAHEAMCEERSKTIFNRLENIEESIARVHRTILNCAGVLIVGMGSIIVTHFVLS